MNRLLFAFLLLNSGWARGADYPAFTAGQKDLAFKEAAPLSSDADLKRRFGTGNEPLAYDISKEKFRIFVPKSYRHKEEWGLLVWVDPSPQPILIAEWRQVLADKKLLFVGRLQVGE